MDLFYWICFGVVTGCCIALLVIVRIQQKTIKELTACLEEDSKVMKMQNDALLKANETMKTIASSDLAMHVNDDDPTFRYH